MRWLSRRRRVIGEPSEDARHAVENAHRTLADTKALGRAADDLTRRADAVNDQWRETTERNGIAEALVDSIMRRARHP